VHLKLTNHIHIGLNMRFEIKFSGERLGVTVVVRRMLRGGIVLSFGTGLVDMTLRYSWSRLLLMLS